MKKDTEKQPVDDLFARKLGNMALPPGADGFDRLQARIHNSQPETRIVFWRNPTLQRYTAAAACIVLVGLFGWLYWASTLEKGEEMPQVAVKQTPALPLHNPTEKAQNGRLHKTTPNLVDSVMVQHEMNRGQLANVEKAFQTGEGNEAPIRKPTKGSRVIRPVNSEPVLVQTNPIETSVKQKTTLIAPVTTVNSPVSEQIATNKLTVHPPTSSERVLIVTIAEPEALAAARQVDKATSEEKALVANQDKTGKSGGLWQQVKRIKQGDLFAHRDNLATDDQGLLERAYQGVKHSFDKDKSAKQ